MKVSIHRGSRPQLSELKKSQPTDNSSKRLQLLTKSDSIPTIKSIHARNSFKFNLSSLPRESLLHRGKENGNRSTIKLRKRAIDRKAVWATDEDEEEGQCGLGELLEMLLLKHRPHPNKQSKFYSLISELVNILAKSPWPTKRTITQQIR